MRGPANATPTSEPVIARLSATASYRRAPDAFVRRTPRSLVILSVRSRQPVRVSGSAVDVWEMLATPRTLDLLRSALAAHLGLTPDAIAADLAEALAVLIEAGAAVCEP